MHKLKQLLIRLLNLQEPQSSKFNQERMEEWLSLLSSERSGYKDYYTYRKKEILEAMSIGLPEHEYLKYQGRLSELKLLNRRSLKLAAGQKISNKDQDTADKE